MTLRDKATPLAVKGMEYGEIGVAAVTVFGVVYGDLGHIETRGHLSIHAHPVPYHLPLTAALSAMPLSLSTSASGVRLGQGPPLGSTPGPAMTAGRPASAPQLSTIGGRRSDQPSGNPPVH